MSPKKTVIIALILVVIAIPILNIDIKHTQGTLTKFSSYTELVEFLRYGHPATYGAQPEQKEMIQEYGAGYSTTNIQVQGVEEADTVKTDGQHIYLVSGAKVIIVKAFPAEEAKVVSSLSYNATLSQIYIDRDKLVVFYSSGYWMEGQTSVDIYDVSNRSKPLLKRTVSADGGYFSSRMIADYVYFIVRKAAYVQNDIVNLPRVRCQSKTRVVQATEVYCSDIPAYSYMFTTVVSVNVQDDAEAPTERTVLTGWEATMYVSIQNIYLALDFGSRTFLHRIHIENSTIEIAAEGEVRGDVVNQFSMDEHAGYFRIATTSGGSGGLENNLYVLDMDLKTVGFLEGIAPRETIHSVRFMGELCYLVTFRKVDPFFVIDLSNPYRPAVLGELKITGYSDYLHMYDENHVIGVGKETVTAEHGDFSWYQGVKVSLLNVEVQLNPTELAKYEIGDRGTDSLVLRDHKAFLFNKEKNLLVIPVSLAVINESRIPYGMQSSSFGDFVWQGAYAFAVSLETEEKIALRGTITHIRKGAIFDEAHHITRTLYIGDVLYTISQHVIMMNSLVDMSAVNELELN